LPPGRQRAALPSGPPLSLTADSLRRAAPSSRTVISGVGPAAGGNGVEPGLDRGAQRRQLPQEAELPGRRDYHGQHEGHHDHVTPASLLRGCREATLGTCPPVETHIQAAFAALLPAMADPSRRHQDRYSVLLALSAGIFPTAMRTPRRPGADLRSAVTARNQAHRTSVVAREYLSERPTGHNCLVSRGGL
jgi:hypothetical protein